MEGKIPMNALSTGYIYKYWNKTFVPQILDQKSYVKKNIYNFMKKHLTVYLCLNIIKFRLE
jgi:hypothetical protein